MVRALYFSVDVGFYIPEALFQSVAQVIAYVYGLNSLRPGDERPQKPKPRVPSEMNFDSNGKRKFARRK